MFQLTLPRSHQLFPIAWAVSWSGDWITKNSSKIPQQAFTNNYCPASSFMAIKSTTQLRKKDSKVVFKRIWNSWALGSLPCLTAAHADGLTDKAAARSHKKGASSSVPWGAVHSHAGFDYISLGFWQKTGHRTLEKTVNLSSVWTSIWSIITAKTWTPLADCAGCTLGFSADIYQPVFLLSNCFPRSSSV